MDKNLENVYDFSNVKTNLENFLLLILTPVLPGSHGKGSQTENKQERQPSTELLFHLQNCRTETPWMSMRISIAVLVSLLFVEERKINSLHDQHDVT